MGQYESLVSATTHGTPDTDQSFIDITPAASRQVKIVAIYASVNTAPGTEARMRIKLCRKSAQGAGSIAGTIVKADPGIDTSANTTQIKDTTNAFAAGTIVDTIIDDNFNDRAPYVWVARDADDMKVSGVAQIIGVNILSSVASKVVHVKIVWRE